MKKIIAVVLLLIPLLLSSCETDTLKSAPAGIYFQYSYINFAWVPTHTGFTITPTGEIFRIDLTTRLDYENNGIISINSLKTNLKASLKTDTIIDKSELDLYKKLAWAARTGVLSDPVLRRFDSGIKVLSIAIIKGY